MTTRSHSLPLFLALVCPLVVIAIAGLPFIAPAEPYALAVALVIGALGIIFCLVAVKRILTARAVQKTMKVWRTLLAVILLCFQPVAIIGAVLALHESGEWLVSETLDERVQCGDEVFYLYRVEGFAPNRMAYRLTRKHKWLPLESSGAPLSSRPKTADCDTLRRKHASGNGTAPFAR